MQQQGRELDLPAVVATAGAATNARDLIEKAAVIIAPTALTATYQLQCAWDGGWANYGAPLVFAGPGVQYVDLPIAVRDVRWYCTAFVAATGDEHSVLEGFNARSV